jgi:MFS transporter, OFA family, oxalate/formate antiporter
MVVPMKKWMVLIAGISLQAILGGVYAWSAFVPSLVGQYGLTNHEAGLIFGVTIAVFTVAMVPAGRLLHAFGPRVTAGIGAVLFAAGYLVASFSGGRFPIILVGIGCLTGIGIGAGYVCPLTVTMKWFPNNKGLVTGVAVAGFGGGAVLLSALVQFLLTAAQWNVLETFRFVGVVLGGVALGSALLLSEPDKGIHGDTGHAVQTERLAPHVFSRTFGLLCLGMLVGTFAGLLLVGNLKPILLQSGLGGNAVTWSISVFAVGNAAGRIIWGQVHDRLGTRPAVLLSLGTLGIALMPMTFALPASYLLIAVGVGGFGFGACFVVYASSLVQHFGTHLFPRLYPLCFLGYGLAGLIAPGLGGWIADRTGSFRPALLLSASMVFLALVFIGSIFARAGAPAESDGHPIRGFARPQAQRES